jgi:hypothetical protein
MNDRKEAIACIRIRLTELTKKVDTKFTDIDSLKCEVNDIIEEYMFLGGEKPVQEVGLELELMGRLLHKTLENVDRAKEKTRTREEWEELEREHIPPAPSFVPKGYAVCACWRCNNIFEKRGKRKYCSEECSQEQRDANKRLKKTGTYLRPYADGYREKRQESTERMAKVKEVYITDKLANIVSTTGVIWYGKRKKSGCYDNELKFVQSNK